MPIENFFAYTILRAALFSAASPAERLRSAGSLAKSILKTLNVTVYILPTGGGYAISSQRKIIQYRIYILPTGRNCAVKSYSMYVDGFSELQLYIPVM